MSNIQAIILAGGKGTRMNEGNPSPIPKALYLLGGKPMVGYILKTLKKLDIKKPTLVIGYKAEMVKKVLGNDFSYVVQKQRLGTGHAAKLGLEVIPYKFKNALILQADDSAFYKMETLKQFIANHDKTHATLSFLATEVVNPRELGRVLRDKNKNVLGIIEKEDSTNETRAINEINCGAYLIDLAWAKKNIGKIKKTLKGGKEYPLPEIVKIALAQNKNVSAFKIPRHQWHGINSPQELEKGEKLMGFY